MVMQSQWHVSGLLSTALETMTLPSRLKSQGRSRETMDQLVNALNINGNQNIAKLRMSIDQKEALNGHHRPGRSEVRAQSRDTRMPSQDRQAGESHDGEEDEVSTFDMDFFPPETVDYGRGQRSTKKTHVFGQSESHRVSEDVPTNEATEEDEGFDRARRRAACLPIIQKLVFNLFLSGRFCINVQYLVHYFLVLLQIHTSSNMLPRLSAGLILAYSMTPAGQEHPCRFPCLTAFPTSSLALAQARRSE